MSCFLHTVLIDDIESVRKGRQTEGLKKYTDSSEEEMCFSIMFKGHNKCLDFMADSNEEADRWVASLQKLINHVDNLNKKQKREQYP